MKKNVIIGLLSLSMVLLSACSNSPVSYVDNTIPSTYSSDTWDETIDKMINYRVGVENASNMIPKVNASAYSVFFGESTNGSYVTEYIAIDMYGINTQSIKGTYEEQLEAKNFFISSEGYYAWHYLSKTDDLIVQYQLRVDADDIKYFELIVYANQSRLEEFPTEFVTELFGTDIPHPEAEAYSYSFDTTYYAGIIYAHNMSDAQITAYNNALSKAKYVMRPESVEGLAYYTSPDGYTELTVYVTADEYNRQSLYLSILSNWPRLYLLSFLGEDLPKFNDESADNLSIEFFAYEGESDASTMLIKYAYASEDDYNSYIEKVKGYGWNFYSSQTYESGTKQIVLNKRTTVSGQTLDRAISVLYGIDQNNNNASTIMVAVAIPNN